MSLHIIAEETCQYICDLPDDDPDRKDALITWSLVSKEFLELSRLELFVDLEFDVPSDDYYTFFELLESPLCSIPRAMVTVTFRGVGNGIGETSALSAFKKKMPIFFRYFKNVEELVFETCNFSAGVSIEEWNTQPFRVRSKCKFECLVLERCIFHSIDAYVQTVAGLASRSRSLENLLISETQIVPDPFPEEVYGFADANYDTNYSAEELPSLRHPLRNLKVMGEYYSSLIIPWLHRNRPMLRKLELLELQKMLPRHWDFFADIIAVPESLEHLCYGFSEPNFDNGFRPPIDLSSRSLTLSCLWIYRTLDSMGMAPEPDTFRTISQNSPLQIIQLNMIVLHPNDLNGIDLGRIDSILASKGLAKLRRVHIHYEVFLENMVGGRSARWEGLESVERKIKRRMPRLEKAGVLHVQLKEHRRNVLVASRG